MNVSLKDYLAKLDAEERADIERRAKELHREFLDTPTPGIYRHFKGGLYTVLAVSRHSETEAIEVVYQSAGGEVWHRPLTDHPKAWLTPLPDGTPRFRRALPEVA